VNKWCAANRLVINLDKTNIITFIASNSPQHVLNIGYNRKYMGRKASKYKVPLFAN
jgi:hypothetical protein